MRRAILGFALASLVGCSTAGGSPELDERSPALEDGTVEALGVLALLDDASTTFAVLDRDVGLDRRAAANLVAHRDGPDAVFGTADDQPFTTIAEADDVRYVGDAALAALVGYARDRGWVPAGGDYFGSFDGVPFTVDQALAALELANTASAVALHDDVGLDSRAVTSIVNARPIATMDELSGLYYVGSAMLQRIKAFVSAREIGVISDLDKTVIPPYDGAMPDAPYPGVAPLYTALEGAQPGDVYYVTARPEWMIDGVPEWLAAHGLPAGPIATGVSPAFDVARAEKVADISAIFDAHPDQEFVLFGDTYHVDPEVMRDIQAIYGDRVLAAFVHDVATIEPERLEGLILFESYGEVATALEDLGVLDGDDARAVIEAASQ